MQKQKYLTLFVAVTGVAVSFLNFYYLFTVSMPAADKIFTLLIALAVLLISWAAFYRYKKL